MKPLFVMGLLALAGVGRLHAAEPGFSAALSPAELEAAGLAHLTPTQRAQLDAYVEKYRSGALQRALAEKQAAEAQAARAEAAVQAARAETAKVQQAAAQATTTAAAPKPAEFSPVVSTIPGKFQGWNSRQTFVLANGQRWRVANNESYYCPVVQDPRVEIRRARLGGYWMWFPDLKAEVRVAPLD